MRYSDPLVKYFRNAGISNCAGFVFHELGLEPKDHYVSKKQVKAYLLDMEISNQPVNNYVMVIKETLHLSLIKQTNENTNVQFRNGHGINKPIQTMPLKEFLSKITLNSYSIEYRMTAQA